MFVHHPLINPDLIEEREYQRAVANICLETPSLVVLPTGMGKTVVALLVMAPILQSGKKVLMMAPTKPLVEQHHMFFSSALMGTSIVSLNGSISPEEREVLFIENDLIVSTPQVIANDLRNERISLRDIGLIIFDEAHRAVGNYAYVKVGEAYRDDPGLVLGMTASPGSDVSKILDVCHNLGVEHIEVRSQDDPDVAPYVHDIKVRWVEVEIPGQLQSIISELQKLYDGYIKELRHMGVMGTRWQPTRKHLLHVGQSIQGRLASGERNHQLYRSLSVQAMALKMGHALEMAQTQGVTALSSYMGRLEQDASSKEGSKASREIVRSPEFINARSMLANCRIEHPKLSRVMGIVSQQIVSHPESRVLVFTHYRDTCDMIADRLSRIPGARVNKLVGQSSSSGDKGLKQKEQVSVLRRFREGEFNVLVATSVGEEGLDIASTDLVVFYEPVASEIRTIQRRGRTGRHHTGEVYVLITKGTMDEAYYHAARNKEKRMKERLIGIDAKLQGTPPLCPRGQSNLSDY